MQDAVSVLQPIAAWRCRTGIRGAALWYIGSEDPSLWSFYSKDEMGARTGDKIVQNGGLNSLAYNGTGEVNFQGEGELLQPLAAPSRREVRTVTLDPKFRPDYRRERISATRQAAKCSIHPAGWCSGYAGGLGNPQTRKSC